MREIKFRAWDKTNKIMREVTCLNFYDEYVDTDEKADGSCFRLGLRYVELMQYTGLKDKNGKEICEGDIIQFEDGSTGVNGDADTFLNKGQVTWEDELVGFSVSNRESVDLEDLWIGELEIVGNIYENPELI